MRDGDGVAARAVTCSKDVEARYPCAPTTGTDKNVNSKMGFEKKRRVHDTIIRDNEPRHSP